jgi:hypothetical protein
MANFGDFQNGVYADAVRGVNSRYPFDFASIERKAAEALPDWVYRYVSAAAGDGRTQRANIAAFSCYGIVPRMMVSPPQRDLSIQLFGEHLVSPLPMPDRLGGLVRTRLSRRCGCRTGFGVHRGAVHVVDVLADTDGGRDQTRG